MITQEQAIAAAMKYVKEHFDRKYTVLQVYFRGREEAGEHEAPSDIWVVCIKPVLPPHIIEHNSKVLHIDAETGLVVRRLR